MHPAGRSAPGVGNQRHRGHLLEPCRQRPAEQHGTDHRPRLRQWARPAATATVTQQTDYVDATGLNDRVTTFLYDFRDRQTDKDGEINFYAKQYFDNLDRIYHNDRYNSEPLRQPDRSQPHELRRSAPHISGDHVCRHWSDYGNHRQFSDRQHVVRRPREQRGSSPSSGSHLATKTVLDSLGRQTTVYTGYNYSDSHATATSVTGDTISEQTETSRRRREQP